MGNKKSGRVSDKDKDKNKEEEKYKKTGHLKIIFGDYEDVMV